MCKSRRRARNPVAVKLPTSDTPTHLIGLCARLRSRAPEEAGANSPQLNCAVGCRAIYGLTLRLSRTLRSSLMPVSVTLMPLRNSD
jgi:hypothetical protein